MKLLAVILMLLPSVAFPQRAIWDSGHRSKLHPMQSNLASACYLIQGLPEAVIGSDFAYDDASKKRVEDRLIAILNASRGAAALQLKKALLFLTSRIYVGDILVLTKTEALSYIKLLNSKEVAAQKSLLNRSIALAMLFYLSSRFAPKEAFGYLYRLSVTSGESPALILRNLLNVAANLTITNKRPKVLDHPAAYR